MTSPDRALLTTSAQLAPPAHAAQQYLRQHASSLVESAHNAVLCVSGAGDVVYANASAERLYGFDRLELRDMRVERLFSEETVERHRAFLARVLAGERPEYKETRHRRADGTEIDVAVAGSPVQDGSVALFIRDVTDRVTAERELARTRALLETHAAELARSNADLEQFAYIAAHDLSEPLRTITGMLSLLREEAGEHLGDEADDYIDRAVSGAARMRALITDLLAYSRIGRRTPAEAPVDLDHLLEEVIESLGASIAERNASVEPTTPLPVISGDPAELHQLLQNLIANGLKFNDRASPAVRLSASRDGKDWEIVVDDDGVGIDPAHAERVFQPFKRLHGRDAYGGTGIGLAICKRIVERRGGRIWIEQGRPTGTRVCFTAPAVDCGGEA